MLRITPWMATLALATPALAADAPCQATTTFTLVVHGGAGTGWQAAEKQAVKRDVVAQVLRAGGAVLEAGGSAVDAVETAIRLMEDHPDFNAGRGGIPNQAGFVELDASIMAGHGQDAGAVAATRTVRNPISAARAAMERSPHLLFVGQGADAFAASAGFEPVDPSWLLVEETAQDAPDGTSDSKAGTVGAVALDRCGHLAAGTSTGGYNTKIPGRVGDSPIVGAGTWADDRVAVSATGWGEYFIRYAATHDVSARMAYLDTPVQAAVRTVLDDRLAPAGATGGLIAVDRDGEVGWHYTSKGMLRGVIRDKGRLGVAIFEDVDKVRRAAPPVTPSP